MTRSIELTGARQTEDADRPRRQKSNLPLPRILAAAVMMVSTLPAPGAAAGRGPGPEGDPSAPWTTHIRRVDEALADKNVRAAVRAWHDAYVAALGSRRWEGMVEVGDAHLRIGEVSGFRKASEPKARKLYLDALFKARNQGSLDGVLRTAEAFAALGDREVVEQCMRIAEALAARDLQARARVLAAAERFAGRFRGTKDVGPVSEGTQVLRVTAGTFWFIPTILEGQAGSPIHLELQNTSGTGHNLTARGPAGMILSRVDLAPYGKAVLELPALAPGRYRLACDRPSHRSLGMQAELVVR